MYSVIIRFFACFFVLSTCFLKTSIAQSINRNVVSSSGSYSENSGIAISYNIGEAVVFTGMSSNAILTQGFEQEDLAIITFISSENFLMNANAFPNPVNEFLYVNFSGNFIINDFTIEVFDIQGKKMNIDHSFSSTFSYYNLVLNFASLNSAVYLVKLSVPSSGYVKTFKINKT